MSQVIFTDTFFLFCMCRMYWSRWDWMWCQWTECWLNEPRATSFAVLPAWSEWPPITHRAMNSFPYPHAHTHTHTHKIRWTLICSMPSHSLWLTQMWLSLALIFFFTWIFTLIRKLSHAFQHPEEISWSIFCLTLKMQVYLVSTGQCQAGWQAGCLYVATTLTLRFSQTMLIW